MAGIFHDASIGNAVHIIFVRLILLQREEVHIHLFLYLYWFILPNWFMLVSAGLMRLVKHRHQWITYAFFSRVTGHHRNKISLDFCVFSERAEDRSPRWYDSQQLLYMAEKPQSSKWHSSCTPWCCYTHHTVKTLLISFIVIYFFIFLLSLIYFVFLYLIYLIYFLFRFLLQ